MNEFRFICARLRLDERVLKILSVTERHSSLKGIKVIASTSSFLSVTFSDLAIPSLINLLLKYLALCLLTERIHMHNFNSPVKLVMCILRLF